MGFYLRKRLSVGPFRFNLSTSGVGVSVGVPGFRVGSGTRGNYVHVGGAGVYYRHTFPEHSGASQRPLAEIDSGAAAAVADSSSEELLEEIRAKRRKASLRPLAVGASLLLLLAGLTAGWPAVAIGVVALLALVAIVAAGRRDRVARTVVIHYELEPRVEDAFRRFTEWARALAGAGRTWHIAASGDVHGGGKYHAGASELVERHVTTVRMAEPPFVKTNVPVLSIGAGRQTLYFLPDRLLVYDAAGVGAVTYQTLDISASRQRFIESGGVPSDATVVGHTWRYVNRNGGPDRRFSVNPAIPICLYDEIVLRTRSGLNEVVQVSRAGTGEGFAAAVRYLAGVTHLNG